MVVLEAVELEQQQVEPVFRVKVSLVEMGLAITLVQLAVAVGKMPLDKTPRAQVLRVRAVLA
jgi:hypothetical protein